MNMDEHLEEIEEDFGSELSKAASTSSNPENKVSARMPWLNANGIKLNIAPKPAPRKSRWSPDVSATAKAENIINTVTENYYGKQITKPGMAPSSQFTPIITPTGLIMPAGGFIPPPMFMPPPMSSLPAGMPQFVPQVTNILPPPTQTSPKENSQKRRPSRSRSRSPRRHSQYSPIRGRSSRSPDILDGINIGHLSAEERRMMEENKIFVKLLLTKLMAIKDNQRLESLHVSLMSIVKRALDEEMIQGHSKRS